MTRSVRRSAMPSFAACLLACLAMLSAVTDFISILVISQPGLILSTTEDDEEFCRIRRDEPPRLDRLAEMNLFAAVVEKPEGGVPSTYRRIPEDISRIAQSEHASSLALRVRAPGRA